MYHAFQAFPPSIAPDNAIPALIPRPNPGASKMPVSASNEEWADRWHIAWDGAWDWCNIQEPDRMKHPTQGLMRQVLRPGQGLHPLIPPHWTAEYDWDGLDSDAFNYWHNVLSPFLPAMRSVGT